MVGDTGIEPLQHAARDTGRDQDESKRLSCIRGRCLRRSERCRELSDRRGVVITKQALSFLDRGRPIPVTLRSDGLGTTPLLHFTGPADKALFGIAEQRGRSDLSQGHNTVARAAGEPGPKP